jgi:uncharacterized membrane protein YgdD (TMEM256/DUF423 family)
MNRCLLVGAVNGFLAVAAGAFAAHGLQARFDDRAVALFKTGADYHLVHALAIVAAALTARGGGPPANRAHMAAWFFTIGVVLFSGSLYVLALIGSDPAALEHAGAYALVILTPLGGLSLLAGWLALGFAALKSD